MSPSGADLFLASCGATDALRLLVTDPASGPAREHRSGQPFLLAGSDPGNGVRLFHPDVSRRHAYFQLVEGRLACIDLGSRTGITWPDGVQSSGWMPPSGVRVGPWTFAPVEAPPEGVDWNPLRDRIERPGWPKVTVEVSGGEQSKPLRWSMSRAIALVGTAPSCRIRLAHPSVSRVHYSLVWTSLGVWLVDLLGRDGTHLNGQPASWAHVADGDEVRVGVYRLRFHYSDAEPKAAAGPNTLAVPAEPPAVPRQPEAGFGLAVPPPLGGAGPEAHFLVPVMQQFNLMQQQLCEQFHQTTLMMFRMFTTMHQEQAALVREEMQQIQRVTGELQTLQQQLRNGSPVGRDATPGPTAQTPPVRPTPASSSRPPVSLPPAASIPAEVPPNVDAWLSQRIEELQAERQTRWQRVLSFLGRQ